MENDAVNCMFNGLVALSYRGDVIALCTLGVLEYKREKLPTGDIATKHSSAYTYRCQNLDCIWLRFDDLKIYDAGGYFRKSSDLNVSKRRLCYVLTALGHTITCPEVRHVFGVCHSVRAAP